MNTKQVIVVRKFPNLRTGKYCSQVAHASMSFLTKEGRICSSRSVSDGYEHFLNTDPAFAHYADEINHWLENSFRKIVCYVNSEEELDTLHQKALDARLISHLIIDNGATEFNGVSTKTALSIGPHWDHKFEGLTDHLPLL